VDGGGLLAPAAQLLRGGGVPRLVRAAPEHRLLEPGPVEDRLHRLEMEGLGVVGGGHYGQLLLREPESLDQPLFDQRQELDRLGR
jgi:hypothetical protein